MAKTAKLKANPISANPRSRASRRLATSLSSNKPAPPPDSLSRAQDATPRPSYPEKPKAVKDGGITKRALRQKRQTRQQRLRQEKIFRRAEDVSGKMEVKVERVGRRVRVGRERRRGWEEVNGFAVVRKGGEEGQEGEGMDVEGEWVDDVDENGNGGVGTEGEEKEGGPSNEEAEIADPVAEKNGVENEEDKIT